MTKPWIFKSESGIYISVGFLIFMSSVEEGASGRKQEEEKKKKRGGMDKEHGGHGRSYSSVVSLKILSARMLCCKHEDSTSDEMEYSCSIFSDYARVKHYVESTR